jgi:hypothetical protein
MHTSQFHEPAKALRLFAVSPPMGFCKTLIVMPRKKDDFDLALTDISDGKLTVYSQTNGYMNRPIFWPGSTMCFFLK